LTPEGFDATLVIVDRFSKYARFIPTTTAVTAPETARLFLRHWVRFAGLPRDVVSDRDPRFTGLFWSELIRLMGITQNLSTAYHPQTDGQTERTNQTRETDLRCNSTTTAWATDLPIAELAYNSQISASTQFSPFELLYGGNPKLPFDVTVPDTDAPRQSLPEAATVLFQKQHEQQVLARANLRYAQERQRYYYDRGRKDIIFEPGEYVLLSTQNLHHETSKVFRPRFVGPFKVLRKIGNIAYKLELGEGLQIHDVFHVSLLRKFQGAVSNNAQPNTSYLPTLT